MIMLFCKRCGSEVSKEDFFCPFCGKAVNFRPRLYRAEIGERLIAYAIDFIVVSVVLTAIAITARVATGLQLNLWSHSLHSVWTFGILRVRSIAFFVYWGFTEFVFGQSVGKMMMSLKVVDADGGPLSLAQVAVESFGKAFILPFDLVAGLVLYPMTWMRLTSYLSGTAVVRGSPECCLEEPIMV